MKSSKNRCWDTPWLKTSLYKLKEALIQIAKSASIAWTANLIPNTKKNRKKNKIHEDQTTHTAYVIICAQDALYVIICAQDALYVIICAQNALYSIIRYNLCTRRLIRYNLFTRRVIRYNLCTRRVIRYTFFLLPVLLPVLTWVLNLVLALLPSDYISYGFQLLCNVFCMLHLVLCTGFLEVSFPFFQLRILPLILCKTNFRALVEFAPSATQTKYCYAHLRSL